MRQRLGVLVDLTSRASNARTRSMRGSVAGSGLLLLVAASGVAAQVNQPAAPPPPPGPAAPPVVAPAAPPIANPSQLQPSAAASAPPRDDQGDTFNLTEALRGGQALTSIEAATRAVQTAPSVARAESVAEKATAAAEQANIAVYPKLELEARYTRVSPVTINIGAGPFAFPENQGLFQARLQWPVSALFFQVIPRHDALVKAAEAQSIQAFVERQTIKLRTRETYYNYARARAALMVAKATLAQTEAHRKDSEALVSAGSIARVELMRAEAQVASAKVAHTRADNAVATARSALFTLIHIDGTTDLTVSENLEEELPQLTEHEDAIYKRALERRSELRALRAVLESQEKSISAARGQGYPTLAIGGTIEQQNPNQRFLLTTEWKGTWAAYAALIWTPTDTWSSMKGIDQAKADLSGTQSDMRSLQDALRVEVSQAYNGFASAHVALDAARAGIAAAEESYRVRREQFRAGAAIAVDVIDSEAQLRQARLDLVNTLIDLRVAKARLDRALEAE